MIVNYFIIKNSYLNHILDKRIVRGSYYIICMQKHVMNSRLMLKVLLIRLTNCVYNLSNTTVFLYHSIFFSRSISGKRDSELIAHSIAFSSFPKASDIDSAHFI